MSAHLSREAQLLHPDSATPWQRRRWLARCGGALLGSAALTACGTRPLQPGAGNASAAGYCRPSSAGEHDLRTCLPGPLPSDAQQAEARSLGADAQRLTVLVIRQRWADAVNRVSLALDGRAVADTVPSSFVRLRMAPGPHVLAARWPAGGTADAPDAQATLALAGQAGEVLCVELVGSVWLWRSHYRLEPTTPAEAAARVRALRLVADVG